MADNAPDPADHPDDGAGIDPFRRHQTARDLFDALIERGRVRIAWIGPGRLLGAAGALLVVAGIGWWLLRSPSLPTEAALPVVTHTDGAERPPERPPRRREESQARTPGDRWSSTSRGR